MVQKLDTHYYDGKIRWKFEQLVAKQVGSINQLTLDQCEIEIKELIEQKLIGIKKAIGLKMLELLVGEIGNWDSSNQINVHELLPLVWNIVRNYDDSGKLLFLEQLCDINGGQCPQGRVTRLLQLIEL